MSISAERVLDPAEDDWGLDEADVSFERNRGILHGEYSQSEGTLFAGLDEYSVTVTERDSSYHVQIRDSDNKFVTGAYIESDDPYGELPENDEELYDLLEDVSPEL